MFPLHDPARHTFKWYCELSGASETDIASAAIRLRDHVKTARELYRQPFGTQLPYDDQFFRAAYLLAYFPYYIEPLYHTLQAADLPDDLFESGILKAAFFGGGPCPEVLGLAAWLRDRAPHLENVSVAVFDREPNWLAIQQVLIPDMLPSYASKNTNFSISSRQHNVVTSCLCGFPSTDLIIAQNFLTEIYSDRDSALQSFEGLVRRSGCRYLVFVENRYDQVREMMNDLASHLFERGLAARRVIAKQAEIQPNLVLPGILQQHLFTGEDGLIARKYVKYHHMVIEIAR